MDAPEPGPRRVFGAPRGGGRKRNRRHGRPGGASERRGGTSSHGGHDGGGGNELHGASVRGVQSRRLSGPAAERARSPRPRSSDRRGGARPRSYGAGGGPRGDGRGLPLPRHVPRGQPVDRESGRVARAARFGRSAPRNAIGRLRPARPVPPGHGGLRGSRADVLSP